jgi:hypothetical protein
MAQTPDGSGDGDEEGSGDSDDEGTWDGGSDDEDTDASDVAPCQPSRATAARALVCS